MFQTVHDPEVAEIILRNADSGTPLWDHKQGIPSGFKKFIDPALSGDLPRPFVEGTLKAVVRYPVDSIVMGRVYLIQPLAERRWQDPDSGEYFMKVSGSAAVLMLEGKDEVFNFAG